MVFLYSLAQILCMRYFLWVIFSLGLALVSCNSENVNAISFVKQTKNPSDQRFTWEDYATEWTKHFKEPYEWKAKSVDSFIQVSFVNGEDFGLYWLVDLSRRSCAFLDGRNLLSRKYGFYITIDSANYPVENVSNKLYYKTSSSEYVNVIHKTNAIILDQPGIYVTCEGDIKNNSGRDLTTWQINGEIDIVYEDKIISEGISNLIAFNGDKNIWKKGESRHFKVRTKDIDTIYANYHPLYVDFNLSLKAGDPIGYEYSKNIYSCNFLSDWQHLKYSPNIINEKLPTASANSEGQDQLPPVVICNTQLDSLEKEHSSVYKTLYNSLDSEDQLILKRSQRNWIKNREKKCLEVQNEYAGGSLEGYMYCQCVLKETQKRIEVLKENEY